MTVREKIDAELDELRGLRDEMQVQLHLGKAEARERWQELERKYEHLQAKAKLLRQESKEPIAEIEETARELVREIRDGYRHLKQLL